jgi:hypothetical protein
MTTQYNGQIHQDKFVLNVLNHKMNGFFLEIGSNHPIHINNSYLLETQYQWRGIMVEYESKYLDLYRLHRPNSIHVINDATQIDYLALFQSNNVPTEIDYLQIDLEVNNRSTIDTLKKLDLQVMDQYKFATVTFEHDVYQGNYFDTRKISREIFTKRGYVCILQDINNDNSPYEDWWVHPDLVDMDYIYNLISKNLKNYYDHPITQKSINWKTIEY